MSGPQPAAFLSTAVANSDDVLDFWFGPEPDAADTIEQRNRRWFKADDGFDALVRKNFAATLVAAAAGHLKTWKLSPRGTLALVIIFDQFTRNIHRGTPQAFAYDARALALARDAVALGHDNELSIIERSFLYLPLEHAEDIEAQTVSVGCFERLLESTPDALRPTAEVALSHAREHYNLIARFGRFPHRNLPLDRPSTVDEQAWLSAHPRKYGQT